MGQLLRHRRIGSGRADRIAVRRPHADCGKAARRRGRGGAAFGSPTIVHFGTVLFLAALLHAPWQTITIAAVIWGLLGCSGVAYTVIVARRMRKQPTYRPVFEDWLFHIVLPLSAYTILAISAYASASREREALFGVGGASLLLLFTSIHNAWDSVAYHVFVHKVRTSADRPRDETRLQDKGRN